MTLAVTQLFTAQATSASSLWYTVQGGEAQFGHNVVFGINGGLGGGACKAEISFDQPSVQSPVNILTLINSLTPGVANTGLILPPGCRVRLTLTGATGATLDGWVME